MSDHTDTVSVAIRVRPLTAWESEQDERPCVAVYNSLNEIKVSSQGKTYKFDYVGDENASQQEIFNQVGRPIVESVLAGFNGTIFAYGQTGTGKTYTIQGTGVETLSTDFDNPHRGLLPRCFEHIFAHTRQQPSTDYVIKCSYLEIYQEQIIDLLDGDSQILQLREDAKRGVYVEGLLEVTVTSLLDTYDLIKIGARTRHIASTNMNKESSRSHSVFTLIMDIQENGSDSISCKTSKFHLIDLAGSERQKVTSAAGIRLKEAGKINKSLSALGNVINSLSDITVGKARHIPYRDSKLTFLLKDSLGGNSKTFIIANVSPGAPALGETSSTLQFAARAKTVKCKPVVNEDAELSELQWLRAELARTKKALADYQCPICLNREVSHQTHSQMQPLPQTAADFSATATLTIPSSVTFKEEQPSLAATTYSDMGVQSSSEREAQLERSLQELAEVNYALKSQLQSAKSPVEYQLLEQKNYQLKAQLRAVATQVQSNNELLGKCETLVSKNSELKTANLQLKQQLTSQAKLLYENQQLRLSLEEKERTVAELLKDSHSSRSRTSSLRKSKRPFVIGESYDLSSFCESENRVNTCEQTRSMRTSRTQAELRSSALPPRPSSKQQDSLQFLLIENQNQQAAMEKLNRRLTNVRGELRVWRNCVAEKNELIQELNMKLRSTLELNGKLSTQNSVLKELRASPDEELSYLPDNRDSLRLEAINAQLRDDIRLKNAQLEALQRKLSQFYSHNWQVTAKEKETLEKQLLNIEEFVASVSFELFGYKEESNNAILGIRRLYERLLEKEQRIIELEHLVRNRH